MIFEVGFLAKCEILTEKSVKLRGLRVKREDFGGGLMSLMEFKEEQWQKNEGKVGILVVKVIAMVKNEDDSRERKRKM